jgi:polysaccharide chain length determinant protein (PEP-CTERM system associated)
MLPGKKYTPDDIVRILRHRIWLLLVPLALVSAATAVWVRTLPNVYRADTLILVVPQRVPESYVKSTINTKIEDRLQSLTQQILSRTRLERIIQDFNLYEEERKTRLMEDVVEQMRNDIVPAVVKGDAFRVSYTGREPRTVMKVTDRLASLFIEENLRDREVLAEGTNQFLESQLEEARHRLIEHEEKLEEFRRTHSGQLPSQLPTNLQAITNTEMQIQSVVESLNRDRDRRLIIERTIADMERERDTDDPPPLSASQAIEGGGTVQQQLAVARQALSAMELRLTAEHPDVQRVKRAIRDLEKRAEAEAADAPASTAPTPTRRTPEALARSRRVSELKVELEQIDRQLATKQKEETRLRQVAGSYLQRVEMVPARESEMAELTRDYDTLKMMYGKLLEKKEDSKVAANLERRQIGEQFKLLDPARLPERPFSPNRQQLNIFGLMGGLAIGFGLIAFVEYRDTTFRTDDEVASVLGLSVLAVIPVMLSTVERRRNVKRRLALGGLLGGTVTACAALVVYTFVR